MLDPSTVQTLEAAHELALDYLAGVDRRPVVPATDLEALRVALGGPLPEVGVDPVATVRALAAAADPGLVATAGPRYFGFVIGGAQPAALAADWLTSAWDQNAAMYVMSPAAAVVEEVVEGWLLDVFGLPAGTSVGFTSGATMARFTALAAARHRVLAEVGWAVEDRGLFGAPEVAVIVGAEAHVTIHAALQMLGLGRARRPGGRRRPGPDAADELAAAVDTVRGPLIVCAQAGNVNTGAFDPLRPIAGAVHDRGGWLHRRGVRPVGRCCPGSSVARGRDRRGGLVDHGRPQVAQRPVRLRGGDGPRPGRPPRGDDARGGVLRGDRRRGT